MKKTILALLIAAPLAMSLSGCVVKINDDGVDHGFMSDSEDRTYKNRKKISKVQLGTSFMDLQDKLGVADFSETYKNGAFVGQHGSWNRAEFSGYKVLYVPFNNGKPQKPQDFLTGFIASEEDSTVYGRPVCVAVAPDGSLLVNDDDAGIIWKVSAK